MRGWENELFLTSQSSFPLPFSAIFSNGISEGIPYTKSLEVAMKKRHEYVSPTLDLMAKKIFSLPDVTAKFIREV